MSSSKRKHDNDDDGSTPVDSSLGSSSDEHAPNPGGLDALSSSSGSAPKEPTREEMDRAAQALVDEGADSSRLTAESVTAKALELREHPPMPNSSETSPVPVDGGPKSAESPPPLSPEYVAVAPGSIDEREAWDERPALSALDAANKLLVRTLDPRAGPTPVAGGVIATTEGVEVFTHTLRLRGADYLPALYHDPRVQIRIVE